MVFTHTHNLMRKSTTYSYHMNIYYVIKEQLDQPSSGTYEIYSTKTRDLSSQLKLGATLPCILNNVVRYNNHEHENHRSFLELRH